MLVELLVVITLEGVPARSISLVSELPSLPDRPLPAAAVVVLTAPEVPLLAAQLMLEPRVVDVVVPVVLALLTSRPSSQAQPRVGGEELTGGLLVVTGAVGALGQRGGRAGASCIRCGSAGRK